MRGKLNRESFRERIEGGFCGRVIGSIAHSNNGVVGRSNDDRSRSMIDHVSKCGLTNVKTAGHMGVDQASPLCELHVRDFSARSNSGIAEQIVDLTKLFYHLTAPRLNGSVVPHVNYRA